ncbi:DUF4113 domain-containing protein [Gloeobacter morelensis]|uniref:DUF4113 domain-containing protein n=1 Tax=Gloeobacter morelensis TaxID=2907343 RepID=UPI003AB966D6|nr:DUF4113 domain-containing protein [Gloeobacter morelensis MG652769]
MRFAGEGIGQRWQTRAQHRSPRWTTRWAELPVATTTRVILSCTDAVAGGGHHARER